MISGAMYKITVANGQFPNCVAQTQPPSHEHTWNDIALCPEDGEPMKGWQRCAACGTTQAVTEDAKRLDRANQKIFKSNEPTPVQISTGASCVSMNSVSMNSNRIRMAPLLQQAPTTHLLQNSVAPAPYSLIPDFPVPNLDNPLVGITQSVKDKVSSWLKIKS